MYQDILGSITPERRFLFSSMEYELRGKFLMYNVWGADIIVDPSVAEPVPLTVNKKLYDDLYGLGIVKQNVPYPLREQVDDGQMKIAENLFKAIQTLDRSDNLSILIVGSSSQAMGGGRSYDMLKNMITNSVVHMYDPHESNEEYVSGSVTYYRYAQKFVYSQDIVNYDLVVDDAYAVEGKNRQVLDPDKWLFKAKNFSCKFLEGDEKYFGKYHAVKQVGKVASWERRVYKIVPRVGPIRDSRFGSCAFCREMFYYSNYEYGDFFFETLASIHSPATRCSIRKKYKAPLCVGDTDYKGRKMYCVTKIENGVCMKFDPVLDYEQVINFKLTSDRTYVFSDIDKIQNYMYAARVAVYDDVANRYYINYEVKDIIDSVCDFELHGIKFRVLNFGLDALDQFKDHGIIKKHREDLFKDVRIMGSPLLYQDKTGLYGTGKGGAIIYENDQAFMWKVYRFFGRFYLWYLDGSWARLAVTL